MTEQSREQKLTSDLAKTLDVYKDIDMLVQRLRELMQNKQKTDDMLTRLLRSSSEQLSITNAQTIARIYSYRDSIQTGIEKLCRKGEE